MFWKKLFLNLKGRYKCEVSAEAPNFQTVFDVAEMSVVGQYYITPTHAIS